MKKNTYNLKITHAFTCGSVLSDEEFENSPPRPSGAKNINMLNNLAYKLSPEYRAVEKAKRRNELAENRKAQLDLEQVELNKKRAEL